MSPAKATTQLTRPKSIKGRTRTSHFVGTMMGMLSEAISTERWGLAHRLLYGLELLTTGQSETTWVASHAKNGEAKEIAAFRSRADEAPPQWSELLGLLDSAK